VVAATFDAGLHVWHHLDVNAGWRRFGNTELYLHSLDLVNVFSVLCGKKVFDLIHRSSSVGCQKVDKSLQLLTIVMIIQCLCQTGVQCKGVQDRSFPRPPFLP
jgi:hypothetical protein